MEHPRFIEQWLFVQHHLKKDKDNKKVKKKMKCSVSFNVNGLQHVHDYSFVENVYLALMVFSVKF